MGRLFYCVHPGRASGMEISLGLAFFFLGKKLAQDWGNRKGDVPHCLPNNIQEQVGAPEMPPWQCNEEVLDFLPSVQTAEGVKTCPAEWSSCQLGSTVCPKLKGPEAGTEVHIPL